MTFGNNKLGALMSVPLLGLTLLSGCRSKKQPVTQPPAASAPILKQDRPAICIYRQAPPTGMPVDYFLWAGEKNCGKETCRPPMPRVLKIGQEIIDYEGARMRPLLSKLPDNEDELRNLLVQADKKSEIIWAGDSNSEIYDFFNKIISSAGREQNIHLVLGFAHAIEGQTDFLNELLTGGKNGKKIEGITHLALEIPEQGEDGENIQLLMDRYLVTQEAENKPVLSYVPWSPVKRPPEPEGEIEAKARLLEIGQSECYNTVLAEMPRDLKIKLARTLDKYELASAREIYAIGRVTQRLVRGGNNVIIWHYGSSHADKHRLPYYLKIENPEAKVISIVMKGGNLIPDLTFDRVVDGLGWSNKVFIWPLKDCRDGDAVLHVPTRGKMIR